MASFDSVNYSLRPSKSIQRQLVFEGVRILQSHLDLDRLVYVGFGSIWFTDFVMAHKLLGIDDMVSIESNRIGFCRAVFNSPYATVRVREGISSNVLPTLYDDGVIARRPWMIWLDYDCEFNETIRDDTRSVIENVPANSILLITFNGNEMKYGQATDRPERLRELFKGVVPDGLPKRACKDERMQETLASLATNFGLSPLVNKALAVVHQGVSSVVATAVTDHVVGVRGQQIDDLPLTFITPEKAGHTGRRHRSRAKGREHSAGVGARKTFQPGRPGRNDGGEKSGTRPCFSV